MRRVLNKLTSGRTREGFYTWIFHRLKSTAVNTAQTATLSNGRQIPKKSEISRLMALAKPEKWRLAAAIGLLFVSSTVSLAVPFGIGKVIDIIYTQDRENMTQRLNSFCTFLFGVFLVGALANMGRVYLMNTSGQRVIKRMREKLFGSIIKQEVAFFDKTKTGELINRLSTDTSLVGQSVTMNISDGLRSTAQAVGGVCMMFYVSPKLCGISLMIVPPIMVMSLLYGRYVKKITKSVQDALAESTQVAEERLANMRTVRAFGQEQREFQKYKSQIETVLGLSYKQALASGVFWGTTGLSGNIIILSVIYQGGLLMNESLITVGELSSFLMYAAYIGVSIGGLSSFYSDLMKGLGASTRLWELMDRQPTIPLSDGLTPSSPLKGHIEFSNISFAYPTRPDVTICKNLSLSVSQGSVIALVGASGSGKSTLAALLLRYYDPDQGQVSVDGMDVCDLNPVWLREYVSIVSQEPSLFSTSIAENIAYGAVDPSKVTPEEIIEAAKKANAYNFIQGFPQGLDTLVGERGVMLSGGQKQRIAIARAILKNPKILLLDEATSALDAESEHFVQEALERIMQDRTVITIAHRLSTIRKADRIALLHEGSVAELGAYDELMQIPDGHFRKLVERQTIATNGME